MMVLELAEMVILAKAIDVVVNTNANADNDCVGTDDGDGCAGPWQCN